MSHAHNRKYVYPGSDILINKFDCHNKAELEKLEALSTGANLAWLQLHPIRGEFDFQHLKDIHYFIFQDVYDWAGQVRTIDIGKNNLFCRTQFIDSYADSIFSCFFMDCYECREDKSNFITALTKHYEDMNALHPFREGNGRAQREFARELCMECGYVLDLTETTRQGIPFRLRPLYLLDFRGIRRNSWDTFGTVEDRDMA